jgi:hypothetical protein
MRGLDGGRELAAYCGLYCGSCETLRAWREKDYLLLKKEAEESGRLQEEIRCEGCKSDDVIFWCQRCRIKGCAIERGLDFCSACIDFPCDLLLEFEGSQPHHRGVTSELRKIQESGVDEWLKEQDEKWRCPSCDSRTTFYDNECKKCGVILKDRA